MERSQEYVTQAKDRGQSAGRIRVAGCDQIVQF